MIQSLILAAGQGKRMRSQLPKVLHCLAGKPILEHVLCTVQRLVPTTAPIVVCGHQAEVLRNALSHYNIHWIKQDQQLGTGHAVLQALPAIPQGSQVLVLYGDTPLIGEQTLRQLIENTAATELGMVTAELANPYGYGRIKRDKSGKVTAIVEEKEAEAAEKMIKEVNSGIYLVASDHLNKWLHRLSNDNAQGEYYFTDIIELAVQDGVAIHTIEADYVEEIQGINDRKQLMQLERFYQHQYADRLMEQGVTIYDPARLDIRGEISFGQDVTIDVNVVIEGRVVIGNNCIISQNVLLRNVQLGDNVVVKANTVIDGAEIAAGAIIGPFARIRPGTILGKQAHVGNFVEVKNSQIGEYSKINHLSYIGDTVMGQRVNVGAGTITCNYDGANKHKTRIDDDVHIGSDSQLVAPVTIGARVTIAAGSTVTEDVESDQLVLTQKLEQRVVKNWKRPEKEGK